MVSPRKDISFALRMLGRNPGFAFVAAATLALGIGANTAIFSLVEGVLLKPLPFPQPDRLTMVWQKSSSGTQLGISELDLADYCARTRVFAGLGGFTVPGLQSAILTGVGDPLEISPSYISANYFSVLGVNPILGRDFLPQEGRRGRNEVAILGYSFWQSRFAGSRDILNRQITLNSQKLQVVGVMGPEVFPVEADVFIPFTWLNPDQPRPRNYHMQNVVGRLRPGATIAEAQREMDALSADLALSYRTTNAGIGAYVLPLGDEITGKVREPILFLLAAVGLVLLIAAGNVANLLLVRAAARQKEIAIRIALGAGRSEIIAQLIVEYLVLSALGGLFGLLLAFAGLPLIRKLGEARIPRLQHVAIDPGVLLFTIAITLATGLLFGLIPALRCSSANLNQTLRAGGRTSLADSGRLRNSLVAAEVALALVVVVAASLLVRSLGQLMDVQPGFRAGHLLTAQVALPATLYPRGAVQNFYQRLFARIAAIPGVVSVSAATSLPLASPVTPTRFAVQGAALPEPGRYPVTLIVSVDPQFFKTMEIPILRGRTFNPEEIGDLSNERCMINATMARSYFPGQDPLGRHILTNLAKNPPDTCQIVGVAGDTREAGLDTPPPPMLYFAFYAPKEMLVLRTNTDPMAVAQALRREIAHADPRQPLSGVRPMDQVVSLSLSRQSFAVVLIVMFAALGLILAALGLYGVVSYSVEQRTQEIGVRMALGAEQHGIFRMILLDGLGVTAIGLAVGIAASAAATRFMSRLLFGVGAADPVSYAAGCGVLVAIAMVACFVPAYRATHVDPITALRHE